jgi:hypothetical protein
MHARPFFGLIALALCTPSPAHADSDGYYCTGDGYVAYRFGAVSDQPHRVYVLRTWGPAGLRDAVFLPLPEFQVHGMVCGDGWIDVASFTEVHRVFLDSDDRPVSRSVVRSFSAGAFPAEFLANRAGNLGWLGGRGAYQNPIRVSLGTSERGGAYFLEISARDTDPPSRCTLVMTSRVVEVDSDGAEVGERIIHRGPTSRECGD